ncbi:MAG: DNA gyrase subunit A [Deltaproteobacteria bacterium]|nr:DNA gyrase subunit A [Deltaproteobacteria bacterium]
MTEPSNTSPRPATPVPMDDEMRRSYLDYSMSVIIGRALPDVRDGLKPVHRRILYAMYDEGLLSNRKYSKCAGVVGEVLKKYHPHGDASVYDALVRLAQEWNIRYPLIDGQGNFGSVDGDPAAAYRYTESRLTKLAEELLTDIEKETVDVVANFDETTTEPSVLPSKFPNLLVNGSEGIAVGMATKMPPHNLVESINAVLAMIDNPNITVHELLKIIPGPDFPTGGFICGRSGTYEAYATGRGTLKVRGKARIEENAKRTQIIIDEIPYQVNKSKLVERMAELVREKKLEGVSDLRDESDRDGMRIAVDLKRDAVAEVVLNQIYKHTPLQTTFGIINLAIVGGQPRVLPLKDLLAHFVSHRREVVGRRTRFELREAEARFNTLLGLIVAVDHIDRVIDIIRHSRDPDEARDKLLAEKFSGNLGRLPQFAEAEVPQLLLAAERGYFLLNPEQVKAILEMRLSRLTGLEREKLVDEAREVMGLIARLRGILASPVKLMEVIKGELTDLRDRFDSPRRTQFMEDVEDINVEDLIAEEEMVVTVTHQGYVKRSALSNYRAQKRGGRGKGAAATKEDDFVEQLFVASTHAYLLNFSDRGKVYWVKVHAVPESAGATKGKALVNLVQLDEGERIRAILPVREFPTEEGKQFVLTATRQGTVKKTDLTQYANPRQTGLIACGIDDGDELIGAAVTNGKNDVLLATRNGMAIRFSEEDVRSMGRAATGVKGIELEDGDRVVGMEVLEPGTSILTVTENGFGKRTEEAEYRCQNRGGKGLITIKVTDRNGVVSGTAQVHDRDEVMIVTSGGTLIRTRAEEISMIGRNTQGVKLIAVEAGDRVVSIARIAERDEGETTVDLERAGMPPVEAPAPKADDEPGEGGGGNGQGG